jgi:hypothetical protein
VREASPAAAPTAAAAFVADPSALAAPNGGLGGPGDYKDFIIFTVSVEMSLFFQTDLAGCG